MAANLKLKFTADTQAAADEMKRLAGESASVGEGFKDVAAGAGQAVDATKFLGVANAEMAKAMYDAEVAAKELEDAEKQLADNQAPEAQNELAEAVLNARREAEAAAEKVEDLEQAESDAGETGSNFADNFKSDLAAVKDATEIAGFAMQGLTQAIAFTQEAADRLGRTEFSAALERAQSATQRLTDSMLELPIGKTIPLFQLLGDAELKNADAITILTRAFNAAGDGMNVVNALLIQMKANATGNWDEATKEVQALTAETQTQADTLDTATRATDAYSDRWSGLADQINAGSTAQANWNQYMAESRAEEEAEKVAALALAQQALAAGLSGVLGNAQQNYNAVMTETGTELTRLQAELDKYTKLNGQVVTGVDGVSTTTLNYTKKIEELNGQVDAQVAKQDAAAAALRRTTAEFVFNQAAASLNAVQQTELAFKLGMIDEASYKASKAAQNLKDTYDTNKDGTVSAEEGADKYIEALSRLTTTIGNEATPATDDHKQALEEAERATGTVATTLNNQATPAAKNNAAAVNEAERATGTMATTLNNQATPAVNTLKESTNNATTALTTAKQRAAEFQAIIDRFESETFTYTFDINSTGNGGGGAPPGGGGVPLAPTGSGSFGLSAPTTPDGAAVTTTTGGGNVYNFYLSDWPELEQRLRTLIQAESAQTGTQADFRSRV